MMNQILGVMLMALTVNICVKELTNYNFTLMEDYRSNLMIYHTQTRSKLKKLIMSYRNCKVILLNFHSVIIIIIIIFCIWIILSYDIRIEIFNTTERSNIG